LRDKSDKEKRFIWKINERITKNIAKECFQIYKCY
jgi:hypothetical protein